MFWRAVVAASRSESHTKQSKQYPNPEVYCFLDNHCFMVTEPASRFKGKWGLFIILNHKRRRHEVAAIRTFLAERAVKFTLHLLARFRGVTDARCPCVQLCLVGVEI